MALRRNMVISYLERRMAERDWDQFWHLAWGHLFNALGMISVVGFFGFVVWGLASGTFQGTTKPPNDRSDSTREATQALFAKSLLNGPKPCAAKGKKVSEIKKCGVLGVRLGMSLDEVKEVLDGSGYFASGVSFTKSCHNQDPQCAGYIYARTDAFSISVNFRPAWAGDTTRYSVSNADFRIDLSLMPYLAPETMRIG
jgi:nitrate reductase NapE component